MKTWEWSLKIKAAVTCILKSPRMKAGAVVERKTIQKGKKNLEASLNKGEFLTCCKLTVVSKRKVEMSLVSKDEF